MKTEEFTGTKNKDAITAIISLLRTTLHLHEADRLPDQSLNNFARFIGTLVFELSTTYTGKASKEALIHKYYASLHGKPYVWCKDHMWPRQVAGYILIDHSIEAGHVNTTVLTPFLKRVTEVNYINKEENKRLMEFQKVGVFTTPEVAYTQAGIILLDWPAHTHIKHLPRIHPHLLD